MTGANLMSVVAALRVADVVRQRDRAIREMRAALPVEFWRCSSQCRDAFVKCFDVFNIGEQE